MGTVIIIVLVVLGYVAFVYFAINFAAFNDRPVKPKKDTRRLPGGTLAGHAEPCYCSQCYAPSEKMPASQFDDTN